MQQQKMRRIMLCLAFFVIFLLGITINSSSVQAATGKEFTENGILYWDYGDGRVYDIEQGIGYRYKSSSKTYTVEVCYSQKGNAEFLYSGSAYYINVSSDEVRDKYSLVWSLFDGNVVIPDTIKGKKVTAIGDEAFYPSGDRIKTVTIGKNVTSIGKGSFMNCTGLTKVTLSDSVQKIGEEAFRFSPITAISIGKNVKSIGASAFDECTKLTTVTIAKGKLTSLPNYCFHNCTALKEIVLPTSITKLGWSAFSGCTKLEKVTIKGKVTTISEYCFADCKSLTTVSLPSSVKTIGSGAFQYCKALTAVKWPTSLKTIKNNAFFNTGLEKISIPSSVTTIESRAFSSCTKLYQAVFTKGTTKIDRDTFWKCDTTRLTIVAPKTSTAYRTFMDANGSLADERKRTMVTTNTKFGFNINSNLMVVGEKRQFAALNYSGTLKWKSSNSSVLKITSSGMATGKKAGTVTLTATAGTRQYTFKIKVLKRTMDNTIKVITTECARPEMSDFEKAYGAFWWLVENVEYDNATAAASQKGDRKNMNMDSYRAKGALENGLAVCQGYALAFKEIMDYYEIPCIYVYNREMDHGWNAIEIDGKWYYVDATWKDFMFNDKAPHHHDKPDNFSQKTYSYDTINTTSRTKSANSSVKAAELTINPYLNAVKTTLAMGGNEKFTLKLTGAKAKSFTSTKTSVATVSKKGVITAKKKGTTTIKVKAANGKTYSCKVTVENPKLSKTTLKLNKGKTYTLNVTGTSQTIIWKSANTKVATVTAKGKVKAVAAGSTKITTTINGKKLTCKVTVHEHSYKKTITKAATCTSKGTAKYTCSCGASYTKELAALGHNYQWKVTKQASATTAKSEADFGSRELICENCKDKKQTETIINVNGKLIYGYFDDRGAVLLRNAVNEARAYYGLSGVTLTSATQLEEAAKLEVVKYTCTTYDDSAFYSGGDAISASDYKGIAYREGGAYGYVAERMKQGAYDIFMNADAKNIGTACFYRAVGEYKSDGSGGSYKLYHIMLLK